MTNPISSHFSFIVRCWRDANGILRGWVVDALTQRAYPFVTEREMTAHIDTLAQDSGEAFVAPSITPIRSSKGEPHENS
jgi:hypothetical protein